MCRVLLKAYLILEEKRAMGLFAVVIVSQKCKCLLHINYAKDHKITMLSLDKCPSPHQHPLPNFDSSVVFEVLHVTAHHAKFLCIVNQKLVS